MYAARRFQSGNIYIIKKYPNNWFEVVENFHIKKPNMADLGIGKQLRLCNVNGNEDIDAETLEEAREAATLMVL